MPISKDKYVVGECISGVMKGLFVVCHGDDGTAIASSETEEGANKTLEILKEKYVLNKKYGKAFEYFFNVSQLSHIDNEIQEYYKLIAAKQDPDLYKDFQIIKENLCDYWLYTQPIKIIHIIYLTQFYWSCIIVYRGGGQV